MTVVITPEKAKEMTPEEKEKIRKEYEKLRRRLEQPIVEWIREHPSKTIIYCQATYDQDYQDTLKCVERVSPHVDYTIIVEDGSLTEEQKAKLRSYPNVIVKTVEFKDNIPEYRNAYLEEAKKIDPYAWILVSDPDELFSESLVKDIRAIVAALEKDGYNMAGINCREAFELVEWLDDLDKLKECPGGYRQSQFYKNLLFKCSPNLRYIGVGKTKNVHETWHSPDVPWRAINLHPRYYYEHRKSALKIWRNAARNLFIGGGGDNVGDLNPYWTKLRQICNRLGIKTWRQFEEYMKKGKVDPELKAWLIDALQAPATNWGTETRETAKWYFALHPDEITPEIEERIKKPPPMPETAEIEAYVTKCYFEILGRHPDGPGKEFYTKAILEGKIPKEALPKILMQSKEYREKFLSTLTPDQIRLAKKWEAYLAISKKAETEGKGIDEAPEQLIKQSIEFFAKHVPPEKYPNVLDIGAGFGLETKMLMEKGYKATGITLGKDNIKVAKERFGVELIEMDMHNLRFPPDTFDAIYMSHTFEHAIAPWMLILEMRFVLKDGGRVFLEVPTPDHPDHDVIWHTNLLYPKQISRLFRMAGFKEIARSDSPKIHRLIYEKLPNNHPDFKHYWGYIQHIYYRRP